MIKETGAAIVAHLGVVFPLMKVEGFPDAPGSYTLRTQHGAILVSYNGRAWSDPRDDVPRHVKEIRYDLTIIKRNLRAEGGQSGVEELIDQVSTQMEGFVSEPFVFFPTRDDFIDEDDGTWFYAIQVTGNQDLKMRL